MIKNQRLTCQMSHSMIVLILYLYTYQFIKPFLDKKMSIFKEYRAFKDICSSTFRSPPSYLREMIIAFDHMSLEMRGRILYLGSK